MDEEDATAGVPAAALALGDRLRTAREAMGASLADIAAQTRVPVRMLEALEHNDISAMPSGPYAVGFARSFARAVSLDENQVAADVRALQHDTGIGTTPVQEFYETADFSRVPPRMLAWTAAGIALLLLIAYGVWRSMAMTPDAAGTATAAAPASAATTAAAAATPKGGQIAAAPVAEDAPVSIRATSEVWFGLDDANGRRPFERTMKAGETYVLTSEQRALTLRTSRPQALQIMLGDRAVPQVGPDDLLVKNVALDAQSLAARISVPVMPADTARVAPQAAQPSAGASGR